MLPRVMIMRLSIAVLSLFLAACSQPEVQLRKQHAAAVDFSGSWEIDYQLSDNLQEKIRTLQLIARSEMQRNDGYSQRIGPVAVTGGQPYSSLSAIVGLGQFTDDISRTEILTVTQSPSEIEVDRKDDFPLRCFFQPGVGMGPSDRCGWDHHQLVFVSTLPDGLRIFHRLTLAEEGDLLNIATTVTSRVSRTPFTLNRVYRKFAPVEEEYDCEYTLEKGKTCWQRGD